jgi:hypothetical protein
MCNLLPSGLDLDLYICHYSFDGYNRVIESLESVHIYLIKFDENVYRHMFEFDDSFFANIWLFYI